MSKLYALLVGINNYSPLSEFSIAQLRSCINDVEAVKAYLQEWAAKEGYSRPAIKSLTNEQATREAVIQGFRTHLCQADDKDLVVFFFSGHGSQEKAPEILGSQLNETLVCYDSRTPEGFDLADKELSYLIAEISKNNPQIIVIADCCHAGE